MIDLMLLAAVQPTVPSTPAWDPQVGLIISISCLLVLLIAPRVIRYPQVGPKLPFPLPGLFNNPSLATFIASMAFGHIIGTGIVLGLTNVAR